MSNNYNQDFQLNNIDLQAILDTINSLPSGGSSGGIETCNVHITGSTSKKLTVSYVDSSLTCKTESIASTKTIRPIKNSIVAISHNAQSTLTLGGNISSIANSNTLRAYFVTGAASVSTNSSTIM